MLKLYGIKNSRALRSQWLCRELGIPVEYVQTSFADGTAHVPEYLAINPNGKIPAIDDDGFHLWESMAVNFYLAKKHRSPMLPGDLQSEALILQWSFWVMTEVEKPLLTVLLQRMEFQPDTPTGKYFLERSPKNPAAEKEAIETLAKPFKVLNAHLAGRDYLLGSQFSLADLNVASVLVWVKASKLDISAYPELQRWLQACLSRPAVKG
jgi:glutathione S-transferase